MLVGCQKLKVIPERKPVFSSLPLLFAQRIHTIVASGIIPAPDYNDFVTTFDKYEGENLIQSAMQCLEKAKFCLVEMNKETVVSSNVNKSFISVFQRVLL